MIFTLFPILAVLAGFLAASAVVVQRVPNMAELGKKLAPYQAGIGLATLVLGVFFLLDMSSMMRNEAASSKFLGVICFASSIVVGFLLGYPLVERYILEDVSRETQEKVDKFRAKLAPFQILGGLVAMGTGAMLFFILIF